MKRQSFLLSSAALALGATPVAAQSNLTTVSLGLTSKTANEWAEYVADELGFYAQNGIKIDFIYTGSAAAGAQQLTAGALDISEVSSTQGIEAVQGGAPITFICEHGTKVPYLLLGKKKGSCRSPASKGRRSSSAAPMTLRACSWTKSWRRLGSSRTITRTPTPVRRRSGSPRWQTAAWMPRSSSRRSRSARPGWASQCWPTITKFFPSFLFDGFAVKPDWAKAHSDLVVKFIKGYIMGVRWLYEPANKVRAIQILSAASGTPAEDAQQTYDLFVAKLHAFSATGLSSPASVGPVLDALVKIGQLTAPAPPPTKFYDNSFASQANAQLRR